MSPLQRNSQGKMGTGFCSSFLSVANEEAGSLKLKLFIGFQLSNYNSFEGVLYCRPHFDQIFKRTGSLNKSFEGTKFLFEWN